ncbi:hypothetical protein N865_12880 [Intrasporangium oryzae NRRL B-24470]|uniref:Uncharacterized protein n=1 Tax=Intrasporangium oryzae NRRL B-24470 TaxID=1386089 RepID=W9G6W7_9MICO|nr:hypothetical protein [Intrasporangium oryzae]EWT01936.1 hypothetical protein N865_12880 [Intrasporangium oryzae NRRL B-24470]
MLTALRQGRVAGLRVTVACVRALGEAPHDVYLVDLALQDQPTRGGGRFDEVPYLECLEPVLDAVGGPTSWIVDVSRTHRSDRDGLGEAHLSVVLALGATPPTDESGPDVTPVVRSAFARMAETLPARPADALPRDAAIAAATDAVMHAFPRLGAEALSLTDEEHHAAEGWWSVGLAQPGVARFQVQLGFVPGVAESAHVRHLPLGEVVDSVGA